MASKTIDERLIPQVQYVIPTTGAIVNVNSNGHVKLVIDPAAPLLSLTIAFPENPQTGDLIEVGFSQAITTLEFTGGTIVGALTNANTGTKGSWVYNASAGKWNPI